MKDNSPIVLFVYNRPMHTQRTIQSLLSNDLAKDSDIYVYADGAKENATAEQRSQIQEVRNYIHSIKGFRSITIVERECNMGLANSVIAGVTEIVNRYGKVIVVEDDLELNPFFLRYMNDALDFYEADKRIFTIGGYNYPMDIPSNYKSDVYASYRCESWGWATWKDRWNKADWNIENYKIIKHPSRYLIHKFNKGGADLYDMLLDQYHHKIDSWAIRWQNCLFENNGLCISPVKTFVQNDGFDGTGVHCGTIDQSVVLSKTVPLYDSVEYDIHFVKEIKIDKRIQKSVHDYFRLQTDSWWKILKRKIKAFVKFINSETYA